MRLLRSFAIIEFHAASMYRLEFWMGVFRNFVGMYAAYWLWTTLYTQQPQSFPISLGQMITYGMIAMILNVVFDMINDLNWYVQNQVRTGALQMDLLRPLNFQTHLLMRGASKVLLASLTLGLPGIVVGVLFLELRPPASLAHGLLFLLSLIPAFLISFSLTFLLSMVSVYTIEAREINWVYFSTVFLFSGQLIPVWIFPPLVGQIVGLLPFQGVIGIPVSIYIGRFSLPEVGLNLGLQVFWAAALLAFGQLVWQKAYTRLTVQGG